MTPKLSPVRLAESPNLNWKEETFKKYFMGNRFYVNKGISFVFSATKLKIKTKMCYYGTNQQSREGCWIIKSQSFRRGISAHIHSSLPISGTSSTEIAAGDLDTSGK